MKGGIAMQDTATLKSFPDDKYAALALLYLQNQDLSGVTPEQLLDMYEETRQKMRAHKQSGK